MTRKQVELEAENARLREALEWIETISDANYEQDRKLRSGGARTLKRISDKTRAALQEGNNNGSANPPTEGQEKQTPAEALAEWAAKGPPMARAAGCFVAINITEDK